MDELVKMIDLNSQNPHKYNLDFFASYFGIEDKEMPDF